MKKKHLSLILRIVFAAAGIAYIAMSLTWSDSVVIMPGTHRIGGQTVTFDDQAVFTIAEGDVTATEGNLTLEGADGRRLIVPASRVQTDTAFLAKPGIPATLESARASLLLIGLLIVGPIYIIQSYRWWLLMRARGIAVTVFKAFRLTMVGSFFNYCMPGTTGGDVVKAYYAARNSDRRADSVMTVIFDRITGLIGLIVLGGLAGLCMMIAGAAGWIELTDEQQSVIHRVTGFIWLGILGGMAGAAVYYSRRLRKWFGISWKRVSRLPGHKLLVKIDDAALAYRKHKRVVAASVLMSLPVHLALAGATAAAGYALGIDTPLGMLLTVVPVLFLAAAVPLTYQGLGVMEGLAIALLLGATATENQIVGMLLMIRFYQIFYSLLGSLFLLKGDIHMHPGQAATLADVQERAGAEAESESPDDISSDPQPAGLSA